MSEIARVFSSLRTRGEGGLIAYVMAGDPEPSCTPGIAEAIVCGGADILELGIPFSDPIADGPTIQAASVRALKAGTTPRLVFKIVEEVKESRKVPVVVLTYYNPIFRMGLENFFQSARACGVDGIVVPDLPIEEAREYRKVAQSYELDTVFLAAPSTSAERLRRIVNQASGFLYLVSVFGVTGAREEIQDLTVRFIKKTIPITRGRIPLAVGFGISKPAHVRTVIQSGAQAAIVGSGFVRIVERQSTREEDMLKELCEYASRLKKSTANGMEKQG